MTARLAAVDTWTIILPFIPEGMNKRERRHWSVRATEKARIEGHLWAYCRAARMPLLVDVIPAAPCVGRKKASRKVIRECRRAVTVEIQRAPSNGQRDDRPNLDSRAKSILDALVGLGYLIDDAEKWLEWSPTTQTKHPDGPRTVITITEGTPTP